MEKNHSYKISSSLEGNVAGIFNYCDRWCEHCNFTTKCTIFKMEESTFRHEKPNEPIWKDLEKQYEELRLKIDKLTNEEGTYLNKLQETNQKPLGYNQTKAKKLAKKYGVLLSKWLENSQATFQEKIQNQAIQNIKEADQISNALEVLKWYVMFIPIKTNCSMHEYEEEILNQSPFIKGSSKVAIIAINRSIQSLVILYELLKDTYEDDILYFLRLLNELRARILIKVPDAMEYVRPGLDETPSNKN